LDKTNFDPLNYLKNKLGCQAFLDGESHVCFEYGPGVGIVAIMQAQSIAKEYEPLLSLQLHEHGASLEKLVATKQIHMHADKVVMSCLIGRHAA